MAMAAIAFPALLVQSIIQLPHMVGYELDEAMRERMKQRELQLSQDMTQLLEELERTSQEQSGFAWGALLFSAFQQWQLWAIAAVVVLLFGLCWWLRKRSHQPASSSRDGSSTNQLDKEEHEEKSSLAWDAGRISVKRLLDLSEGFTVVEDLMDELLSVCRKHSQNSFMPRLKSVFGVHSALGGGDANVDDAVYRLLVPLKPPRGHAFHLEPGTAGEMPAEYSCLRVELECTCTSKQLATDMLCFLHHPKEKLRINQGASLLGTLCTGPYLDTEKTTQWFQNLVKDAWEVLPQSRHCHLTVLPTRHSCKLRLTDASNSTVLIQVMFAVQHGDSYALLRTK